MSDTTPDADSVSDDDIYGVVKTDDDGVTIDERASPPERPSFHDDIVGNIRANLNAFEDVDKWIIAQEASGDYQTWYPFSEVVIDFTTERINFENARRSVSVGHHLNEIVADEAYIMDDPVVRSRMDDAPATFADTEDNHIRISESNHMFGDRDGFAIPERRPHGDLSSFGSWVHATSPDDGSNYELFVPIENAEMEFSRGRLFQLQWDEDAIFRYYGSSTSLTTSQNGLNSSQFFVIQDDMVPDVDGRDALHVDVLEENADLLGRNY